MKDIKSNIQQNWSTKNIWSNHLFKMILSSSKNKIHTHKYHFNEFLYLFKWLAFGNIHSFEYD